MATPMEKEPSTVASFTRFEAFMLLVGFIVVSITFAAFVSLVSKKGFPVEISLPSISIAGIILLLMSLTAIAYVFARAGLQDKTQALGLPAGSIQSVIALSLIVLFAILSVFVFTSMGQSPTRQLRNLSASDREAQIGRLGTTFAGWEEQTEAGKFTIYVRDPGADAKNDIGKQLIVLIGTLMTSAVSFYFGSRATIAGAAAVTADPALAPALAAAVTITTIEPDAGVSREDPKPVVITGTNLGKATSVTFKLGVEALVAKLTKVTNTQVICEVGPITAPPGSYDVSIVAGDKEIAARKAGLKVIA